MTGDAPGPGGSPNPAAATREDRLSQTFVTLADTLVADYDIVEMLDQLVHACVELLEVSQAGLMLVDERGRFQLMATSDEATQVVELFQIQGVEGGPCVEAARSGDTIAVQDLTAPSIRWPLFAATALQQGFRSVHAVPMRVRDETIGALNLFNVDASTLSPEDGRLARALAHVATIGIVQQRSLHRSSLLTEQLQGALSTRVVIEQAKGILAEFGSLGMDQAFEALRSYARGHGMKLSETAAALVRRDLEPAALLGFGSTP
jgi:GAF domain-containing protein